MSTTTIKYFLVTPDGYKQTYIKVKEFPGNLYLCLFTEAIFIDEFGTLGFKVNGQTNEIKLYGSLSLTLAFEIWFDISNRLDNPDQKISFEGFVLDDSDSIIY